MAVQREEDEVSKARRIIEAAEGKARTKMTFDAAKLARASSYRPEFTS